MSRTRIVLAIALLAAGPLAAGCASKCGTNCPAVEIAIWASPGETLIWTDAHWEGPACPDRNPACRGDDAYSCVRFDMMGSQAGVCDLTITFKDRPPFMVHGEFGEETHQGCCRGFPVVGPSLVFVPPLPGYSSPDAGTDTGAGVDAGATAATDALSDAATDTAD